jgi:hypothetical protein
MIVSRNDLTADALRSYFEQCGVPSVVTDRFDAPTSDDEVTAIVVFPDEFPAESAAASIERLAKSFLGARIIVVTRHTARFEQATAGIEVLSESRVVVLPRPVWGWALLDRILKPPPRDSRT